MGERRMLSKFAPPGDYDPWDPSEITRRRQPSNQPTKVRIHLPMSLRCHTCRNIMYERTRINSRKECCSAEMDSGSQIFRFSFKCYRCSAEITFKSDPQSSYYTVESGASRHVEPWCEEDEETSTPLSTTLNSCKKQKTEPTAGLHDFEESLQRKTV